jgi:hypothetical protein
MCEYVSVPGVALTTRPEVRAMPQSTIRSDSF